MLLLFRAVVQIDHDKHRVIANFLVSGHADCKSRKNWGPGPAARQAGHFAKRKALAGAAGGLTETDSEAASKRSRRS